MGLSDPKFRNTIFDKLHKGSLILCGGATVFSVLLVSYIGFDTIARRFVNKGKVIEGELPPLKNE